MRTIRTKVYQFSELSKAAQSKAVEVMNDINTDFNWWQFIYEDAAQIGLKLDGFEFDSASFVRNLGGEFTLSACEVAANIFRDHGENCETYKTAESFMEIWQPVFNTYMKTEKGEDKLIHLETKFLNTLLADYKQMLQDEYDHQCSREAIIETIEANEYEFDINGKLQ
jgi:hypothetical protein